MDITTPLRLAVGSHEAGSGKGCAMNLISWESGDMTITDLPGCADPMLARIVQSVNDQHCSHRHRDLLCPPCSLEVLALAHRTVGTSGHGLSDLDLRRVHIRVAARLAREVVHLARGPLVVRAIEAAEAWANDPTADAANAAYAAAHATNAAYDAYDAHAAAHATNATNATNAADAAYAAAYAAYAAADAANAAYAAYAAANAACAAALAAYADDRRVFRMRMAHLAVDEFLRLTGLSEQTADPARTEQAVRQMCAIR